MSDTNDFWPHDEPMHRPVDDSKPSDDQPEDEPLMPENKLLMRFIKAAIVIVILMAACIVFWVNPGLKTGLIDVAVLVILTLITLRVVRGSVDDADARADALLEVPVTPSKRARRAMTHTEYLWIEARQHPMLMFWWYTGALVLLILTAGLFHSDTTGMLYSWLAILVVLAVRTLLWAHLHNCFSDWRVFQLSGLASIHVKQMAYSKMTDAKYTIPWHSRLLAWLRLIKVPYGTLILESAGQAQALTRLRWVQDIEALWRHMSELTRESTE